MRYGAALVTALALLTLSACNKEKGPDCQKLVQLAGPRHLELSNAFGQSAQAPSELETQAASFEQGAKDLEALDVKDDSVKSLAREYAAVLNNAAKVRRDLAAAASALDPVAQAKVQASATSLVTEEMRVKARIDTTCR